MSLKDVEDLKDLESFEKKVLQEVEKQKREEAKNYLRLLTIGAESIWSWWHPSCLTRTFISVAIKASPNGGSMFPFGIVWPSATGINAVKLSQFISYCKKSFGEDATISNGFITSEHGRLCYVWYLNASMLNGLSELIKEEAKIYSLSTTQESNLQYGHTKKSKRCKFVEIGKLI
jgi:hypothetical protein